MKDFTHFDETGAARMVDVSAKPETERLAKAVAKLRMQPSTLRAIRSRAIQKGDVESVARLAGIMAAKKTDELIPLCHSLPLTGVTVDFTEEGDSLLVIVATARIVARTGVEMEALTAVSIAALTVYDMCKAVDKGMTIESIALLEKHGGRSGSYQRPTTP